MDDQGVPPGGNLSDRLNGLTRGVNFIFENGKMVATTTLPGFGKASMMVVVDGVVMTGGRNEFDINSINSNDVETVEVLRYANATMYGVAGANGVIAITTKIGQPRNAKDIPSFGVLPITPRGYYLARAFYSPRYESADGNFKRKDLRTTVFWSPEIFTAKDGNAAVEFYNADGPGSYRMVIEGIDEKGNLGRRVFRYTVK
jgi:TonB-dependent SusC/RagA subfamily outer membrane receptor